MFIPRPSPPNWRRKYFSLIGTVERHKVIDRRNLIMMCLSAIFPEVDFFHKELCYMLVIRFDARSYLEATKKLEVPVLNEGAQKIPDTILFQVKEPEGCLSFPIGTKVNVALGVATEIDQWFGCKPVDCKVSRISDEKIEAG